MVSVFGVDLSSNHSAKDFFSLTGILLLLWAISGVVLGFCLPLLPPGPKGSFEIPSSYKEGVEISNIVSLFGSSFIWISFIVLRYKKTLRGSSSFQYNLVSCMAICDTIFNGSLLFLSEGKASNPVSTLCNVQGLTLQFSSVAGILWSYCIAFHLHQQVFRLRRSQEDIQECVRLFHILCWGLSIFLTIIVGAEQMIGFTGYWCYIGPKYNAWVYLVLYSGIFWIFCFNAVCVVKAVVEIFKTRQSVASNRDMSSPRTKAGIGGSTVYRPVFFLLAFLLTWLIPLINRVLTSISSANTTPLIGVIHTTCVSLNGTCLLPTFSLRFSLFLC